MVKFIRLSSKILVCEFKNKILQRCAADVAQCCEICLLRKETTLVCEYRFLMIGAALFDAATVSAKALEL